MSSVKKPLWSLRKPDKHRPAAQHITDIGADGPDIRPLGAGNIKRHVRKGNIPHVQTEYLHFPRRYFRKLSCSGIFIQRLAFMLQCRISGRDLFYFTHHRLSASRISSSETTLSDFSSNLPFRILRVRLNSQQHGRQIGFVFRR